MKTIKLNPKWIYQKLGWSKYEIKNRQLEEFPKFKDNQNTFLRNFDWKNFQNFKEVGLFLKENTITTIGGNWNHFTEYLSTFSEEHRLEEKE